MSAGRGPTGPRPYLMLVHKEPEARRGLCVCLHLHAPPQHGDLTHAAWLYAEAILAALAGSLCGIVHPNFGEYPFRDCMKSPQTRARRLVMRRIIAAYTNASPLA